MFDFLEPLFTSEFMPHGMCYEWTPGLIWLHALSDGAIALSYYAIPFLLVYFVSKRKDIAFKWMFVLFGAFILACGTTHLLGVWTIWNGTYWLTGSVKLVTAVVSASTAVMLVPIIPRALALPSPSMLREANEALEKEVAARKETEERLREHARQLDEANRKLRESERLKDEFLANVSHELRTPLTLILSPLEELLADEERQDEKQRRHQVMHDNAVRLLQMVNGLLDFSKLEAGKVEVEREPAEVIGLTEEIVHEFEPLFQQKALEGIFVAHPEEATVEIDSYLYERILFNLLSNAVKFTPQDGKVTVSVELEEEMLRLGVADTGIGIEEEELTHLFDKFRQIEGSSTRRYEGTGIGLSLVKEFTELLGGSVTVESRKGEGTIFTVRLPVQRAEPGHDEAPEADRSRAYATPTARSETTPMERSAEGQGLPSVLVAEDNGDLATHLADLLVDHCHVRLAPNGAEALAQIRRDPPDLVITDVMMPELDGFELCRAIKSDAETTHIPVVLLTALTNRDHLLEGWEAGADEYIHKPFHPKEFVTRIRTMLRSLQEKRRAKEQMRENEARYRSLLEDVVDNVRAGIFILDADFQIVWANEAIGEFFGIDRDHLVGQDKRHLIEEEIQAIFEDPDHFRERLFTAYDDNSTTESFTCHVLESETRPERWLEHWSRPVRTGYYAGGRVELYTDITELRSTAIELEQANETLERRNRELQQFAYIASHDLKEPLRKIISFSDILSEEYEEDLDEEGSYLLDRIVDGAQRMSGLLQALLGYSRVATHGRSFERVDLNRTTREVLSDLELALNEANASVEVDALPEIEADPVQMRQLFQNLIANAVKYRREETPPLIEIRGRVCDDEGLTCKIDVRDNGIGFDEKYSTRIFAPFERLHGRAEYPGTGMGLAICQRIVERHGGAIEVQSAPGEGTTITVVLPVSHES